MADILQQFETIAAITTAIATIKNMVIAMSTIQSSPIDTATRQHNWLFAGYLLILLAAAVLTWLVWRSGNRVQDLARKEADARISESNAEAKRAGESAARANERAGIADERAARANERAATLEKQNIQLRTDLESATTESRTRQAELAREQSILAVEQRKTAEAQREAANAQLALKTHLEAVAHWQQDRKLSADDEAFRFAGQILRALLQARWYARNDPFPVSLMPTQFELGAPSIRPGITLLVPADEPSQSRAKMLAKTFEQSGCPVRWAPVSMPGQSWVEIIVGSKPAFSN